jgi:NAD(P)H-quinone oxidoreductase subunit 4
MPWLSLAILFPIACALFIPLLPDGNKVVKWYSLGVTLITFLITVAGYVNGYDPDISSLQMAEKYTWVPQLGLSWSVGADGLSMPLILLSSFITSLAALAAWQLELVPVYLMISIWGGKKRQYASTKFILYTAGSSLFILLAGLAMGFWTGTPNFEYTYLMEQGFPPNFQLWCYGAFLIAFGVKLPIVPFHTWLPDAHGEATAPVHMLLAGILLKMGGYALLRFNCQLLPEAHKVFAPALIIMGAVNIIYAALTSFAQRNLKRKIAYSSISHMGFVLIGVGSYSALGTSGAMLQMISHGLIGASLFFLVGATYDRTHTLQLDEMGGVGKSMKVMFALWVMCSMASLALPGMSGFISELMVFTGFATDTVYALPFRVALCLVSAIGVILTPIYLLSMLREIFYGKPNPELVAHTNLVDAEPREVYIVSALLVPIIVIGLYPRIMTDTYKSSIDALVARDKTALVRPQLVRTFTPPTV